MKRFPLRLRIALAKSRLWSGGRGAQDCPVRFVYPEELLHSEVLHPVSHEAVRAVLRERKSVVWLGGSEPLAHPGIGHLARLILQSGHFLFLETDGILLRQRIHEFQSKPRFYLAVRFLGSEAEHDSRAGRQGAFRAAMEGIRAARLSGFWICAVLDVSAESQPARGSVELCAWLSKLDVDGILVRPSASNLAAGNLNSVVSPAWARLSQLVESAAASGLRERSPRAEQASASGASDGNCEEGAQA